MSAINKYEVVIGLEVHAQLLTKTKLFCGDSAAFSTEPNTHISPVTLAHPGTLPMMNRKAVEYALRLGLSLGCDITRDNYFARKNYFYPDLPKGYQVSQHTTPICTNGAVPIELNGERKAVLLNRIHMEEDAGKSIHDADDDYTCIDLNRAGVPLLEIVTDPVLHSSEEAFAYLTELRKLVRWIGICDGNMEEGSMRCDANISIRLRGETSLGTRVEVKNLNSIRNVKRAIDAEVARLVTLAESGGTIVQETRSYDADNNSTFSLRTKEDADDYRYFPEPDLTPFHITGEFLQKIKEQLPELPEAKQQRYINDFGLSSYDAAVLCDDKEQAAFFEAVVKANNNYKAAANWMLGPVKSYLNEHGSIISAFPLSPDVVAKMITLVDEGKVSFGNASSRLFQAMLSDPQQDALATATKLNLLQESDTASLESWVNAAIEAMPDKVKEYKSGKKGLIGLFAGEVKKRSQGKADMQQVTRLLQEKLNG